MGIFKKKAEKKPTIAVAAPPEEIESPAELKAMEDSPTTTFQQSNEVPYREVPVCLSQTQINNLVIENNIMLKQIIAELD